MVTERERAVLIYKYRSIMGGNEEREITVNFIFVLS
jgi:hypothetical protein